MQYYAGQHFLARGFHVDSVALDEKVIAEFIRNQERIYINKEEGHLGLGG